MTSAQLADEPSPASLSDEAAAIQTQDLTRLFDGEAAVENVTMTVPQGKIFGFIGPSGSGKTTTIRLLTGIYEPTSGEATVLGVSPSLFDRRTREKIGYLPQLFVLYPELTVWENLNFVASMYGMKLQRRRRLHEVLEFVELDEDRRKLARNISGGMQRRLSLAATLVHQPELIFLDEPTAGVDPVLRRKFWDHFNMLREQGRTLFVTTQYVSEANYCDLVGVLAEGHLLMVDTPGGLRYRAYGGDIVDMVAVNPIPYETLRSLEDLPFITKRPQRESERHIRLIVTEAATNVPELLQWSETQGIAVESIEEYSPPYDDVFVELVKETSDRDR